MGLHAKNSREAGGYWIIVAVACDRMSNADYKSCIMLANQATRTPSLDCLQLLLLLLLFLLYLFPFPFVLTRLITSFTAADPFENDGMEWVRLTVGGQSFMMHQIRKMVSSVPT